MNKYRNIKTVVDGITFDSKKEAAYYGTLKMRVLAKEIDYIATQKPFNLVVNEIHICNYVADFVTFKNHEIFEVIDVKSKITASLPVYRLKKRLMLALYSIEIIER